MLLALRATGMATSGTASAKSGEWCGEERRVDHGGMVPGGPRACHVTVQIGRGAGFAASHAVEAPGSWRLALE
jgi:hypothetical protein